MISFMIFGNALAFLIKPNTITENRKQKQLKKRERKESYLALTWPGPARPSPLA